MGVSRGPANTTTTASMTTAAHRSPIPSVTQSSRLPFVDLNFHHNQQHPPHHRDSVQRRAVSLIDNLQYDNADLEDSMLQGGESEDALALIEQHQSHELDYNHQLVLQHALVPSTAVVSHTALQPGQQLLTPYNGAVVHSPGNSALVQSPGSTALVQHQTAVQPATVANGGQQHAVVAVDQYQHQQWTMSPPQAAVQHTHQHHAADSTQYTDMTDLASELSPTKPTVHDPHLGEVQPPTINMTTEYRSSRRGTLEKNQTLTFVNTNTKPYGSSDEQKQSEHQPAVNPTQRVSAAPAQVNIVKTLPQIERRKSLTQPSMRLDTTASASAGQPSASVQPLHQVTNAAHATPAHSSSQQSRHATATHSAALPQYVSTNTASSISPEHNVSPTSALQPLFYPRPQSITPTPSNRSAIPYTAPLTSPSQPQITQAAYHQLELHLRQSKDEVAALNSSIELINQDRQQLQQRLEEALHAVNGSAHEVQGREQLLMNQNQRINELQRSLLNEQHSTSTLRSEVHTVYDKLMQYEQQHTQLLQQLTHHQSLITEYQQYILRLESTLHSKGLEKSKYREVFKQLESRLRTEVDLWQKEKDGWKSTNALYIQRLNDSETQYRQLKQQLYEVQHGSQKKETDLQAYVQQLEQQLTEVQSHSQHNHSDAQHQVETLRNEMHALRVEYERQAMTLKQVDSQRVTVEQQYSHLAQQCETLKAETGDVRNKYYELQHLHSTEHQHAQDVQAQFDVLQHEYQLLITQHKQSQSQTTDTRSTVTSMQQQLQQMSTEKQTQQAVIDRQKRELLLSQQRTELYESLKQQVQQLQKELEQQRAINVNLSNHASIDSPTGVSKETQSLFQQLYTTLHATPIGMKVSTMLTKLQINDTDLAEWLIDSEALVAGLDHIFTVFKQYRMVQPHQPSIVATDPQHHAALTTQLATAEDYKTKLIVRLTNIIQSYTTYIQSLGVDVVSIDRLNLPLPVLRLSENGLEDRDIQLLCSALRPALHHIKEIDIRSNKLSSEGLLTLTECVIQQSAQTDADHFCTVELLDFQQNNITLDGLESLATLVANSCKLQWRKYEKSQQLQEESSTAQCIVSANLRKEQTTLMPIVEVHYSNSRTLVVDLRYNRLQRPQRQSEVNHASSDESVTQAELDKKLMKKVLVRVIKILSTCADTYKQYSSSGSANGIHHEEKQPVGQNYQLEQLQRVHDRSLSPAKNNRSHTRSVIVPAKHSPAKTLRTFKSVSPSKVRPTSQHASSSNGIGDDIYRVRQLD